ncbi:MAG: VCBS repeat-containing protein [Planctomycetes bacterium]|nr:VCBS repeat-containing protein [Planctomycetota bacterium]
MMVRWIVGRVLIAVGLSGPLDAAPCQPGFAAGPVFDVGDNGGMNALADFDGDGDLDLTTGHYVFLNDGAGGFQGNPIPILGAEPPVFDARAEDFDGDGILDLALCRILGSAVQFFHGRVRTSGSGLLFEDPVDVPARDIWHMVSSDFDEDGRPDVFAVGMADVSTLVLNQGERRYRSVFIDAAMPGHPIATGDFDGDGHADVAFGAGDMVTFLLGGGDGTFPRRAEGRVSVQGSGIMVHRYRAADFDGDGRSDLVAIGDEYALVYAGAGIAPDAGLPAVPSAILSLEKGPGRFVEIADVDGDGRLDVVTLAALARDAARLRIFYGQDPASPFTFVAGAPWENAISGQGAVLGMGDVNGDGAVDIVLTSESSYRGQVLFNGGSCLPRAARGDANADGHLDIGDPIAALNHIVSSISIPCPPAAEVNGDGRLDIADPVYLLMHMFASGPAPVGPTPVPCWDAGGGR